MRPQREQTKRDGGADDDRRQAAPAPPARSVDAIVQMQQGHGNAYVSRLLAGAQVMREPAAAKAPEETTIRKGSSFGYVVEGAATLHAAPDESSAKVDTMAEGDQVELQAKAGDWYRIEWKGKKAYVRDGTLATLTMQPNPIKEAEFEKRGKEALAALEQGYKAGSIPGRGGGTAVDKDAAGAFPMWFYELQQKLSMGVRWGAAEEAAQKVLEEYATWYMSEWNQGQMAPNLKQLFPYLGRSSINDAAAGKDGYKRVAHYGGGLKADGKKKDNWCTQATTDSVINALHAMGFAPTNKASFLAQFNDAKAIKAGRKIWVPAAYSAPLQSGDQVMYYFKGCQYGGHTVTIVDDLGDSFTHISGNTGAGVGVGIGEAKRLKEKPQGFDVEKANVPGDAGTKYLRGFDGAFGDKKLVYSIIRFSDLFEELEPLPDLPVPEQDAMLAKYKLKRIAPAAAPAAPATAAS